MIIARGDFATVARRPPRRRPSSTCASGILLPGLVDTHVHFPQVRVIGALGMPLLEWLDQCALPEEQRLADADVRRDGGRGVRRRAGRRRHDDVAGLRVALRPGRGRALRRGGRRFGLRVTSGLVVSDRMLPEPLLTTPERAYDESRRPRLALARQGPAPLRRDAALLAVGQRRDPRRRAPRCSARSRAPGSPRTSTRTPPRSPTVAGQFPDGARTTSTPTTSTGCSAPRSVLAHNVHPTDAELAVLAARGAVGGALPDQQLRARQRAVPPAPPRRGRRAGGAGLATSVPAPASRCSRRACRPTSCSACSATEGLPLTVGAPAPPGTAAGARALGPRRRGRRPVGGQAVRRDLGAARGRRPARRRPRHAESPDDALAKVFALGADVRRRRGLGRRRPDRRRRWRMPRQRA